MIKINDTTFDGVVIHTPNERINGQNRATVTITTSELTIEQALELFKDGAEWGILDADIYYDWSSYDVAGKVSDNRDGTISIMMGKLLGEDLIALLDTQVSTRKDMNNFAKNVINVREILEDDMASTLVELYPILKQNETLIPAGTRINWNGVIKKAAVDLWDTEENNPNNAPSLWEDILYKKGIRVIPETITATTAFARDEQGWWEDILYVSLIDANVYTPEQYPDGWKVV